MGVPLHARRVKSSLSCWRSLKSTTNLTHVVRQVPRVDGVVSAKQHRVEVDPETAGRDLDNSSGATHSCSSRLRCIAAAYVWTRHHGFTFLKVALAGDSQTNKLSLASSACGSH